jgi:hypothetical protein
MTCSPSSMTCTMLHSQKGWLHPVQSDSELELLDDAHRRSWMDAERSLPLRQTRSWVAVVGAHAPPAPARRAWSRSSIRALRGHRLLSQELGLDVGKRVEGVSVTLGLGVQIKVSVDQTREGVRG